MIALDNIDEKLQTKWNERRKMSLDHSFAVQIKELFFRHELDTIFADLRSFFQAEECLDADQDQRSMILFLGTCPIGKRNALQTCYQRRKFIEIDL